MEERMKGKMPLKLNPFGAWAFALGTSVGWGSMVVTSNTYLAQAGPWGSVIGLLIGAAVMLIISRNYSYMIQIYPDAGGAYTYAKEAFGHDHGFLAGWFLVLTYLAMLWANATSIPLFVRNFVGDIFQFGRLYTLFGYDVYAGEILLTMGGILLIAAVCLHGSKTAMILMSVLVSVFMAGIIFVFIAAMIGHRGTFEPGYIADSSALSQIIRIAVISPWAFIGFENISHAAEEYSFKRTKVFRVLVISVISATLLYVFVTLLSVTAYPERYGSWLEYIRDRGNLSGLEAFPAFYAANHYLGGVGVGILMASLMALVLTSLIGNSCALSRLFYAQAKDKILPEKIGKLNKHGIPGNAIWLIVGISMIIPFVGRTAIGWIVDVTTVGATLIYGFVSAATMKTAKIREDRTERITGLAGLLLMIGFGVYLLAPSLISTGTLEKETYFLFIVWSILGFLYFRWILEKDKEKRFGNSVIVWVALLALVLLVSLVWMRQSLIASNDQMLENVRVYYEQQETEMDPQRTEDEHFIVQQMDELEKNDRRTILMSVGMFAFAIAVMLNNHKAMNRRTRESETIANIDPMTGVKSKHAYLNKEREMNHLMAENEEEEFAVAVCDVNGLKKINDTFGHKAGDEYICSASRMICDIFDHSPVYRIGGDEFVVILMGRDYGMREQLMQLMHDRSVEHIASDEVVVSGGMAERKEGDTNFHEVFERADQLMYLEKQRLKGLGAVTREKEEKPETETAKPENILKVRKKILIAEDVALNQMMLGEILEEEYDLLYASDGVETLEVLTREEEKTDLVLLDLQMPRMDGFEVLKSMKSNPEMRDIPVIVMTGDQESEVRCLEMGAIDFIPKPYPGWEIIRARVSKSLELTETKEIIQSTERDHLTKLFNIDYFVRYVQGFDRHYGDGEMDAIVIDVNHFQNINERFGKQYGDGVLRRIGERIRQTARITGGVGCRQGADIFLLYCPHREDYEDLLKQISEGVAEGQEDIERVRLRMGVYANADKSLDIERRFDRAKQAADTVRGNLVQTIGFYNEEIHALQLHRERLLEDFRPSLEQGNFKVYLQPKFDIRPEKPILASAEALVRWVHPELGMVSPAEFIPLLEESGLILELDQFVWRETAKRIRYWKDRYGFSIPVSVNVSRIDMLETGLKEIFREILDTNRLTPQDMLLEITESAYTGEADQVITMARELGVGGMGFRIEMDDFGTGYSSLGMLKKLPIDALKLDMTFVRTAFGEVRDVRMIELILDIANYLQVPVVAEGVETEEQMKVLKEMGCDLVQGYYFSKPVPFEEFDRFMEERKAQNEKA